MTASEPHEHPRGYFKGEDEIKCRELTQMTDEDLAKEVAARTHALDIALHAAARKRLRVAAVVREFNSPYGGADAHSGIYETISVAVYRRLS